MMMARLSLSALALAAVSCATTPGSEGEAPRPAAAPQRLWWESGPSFVVHPPVHGPVVESLLSDGYATPSLDDVRFSARAVASPYGSFGQSDFSGSRLRTLALSYGAMWSGTVLPAPTPPEGTSVCGPSAAQRGASTLVCLSRTSGELLDLLPLPGELSAAPLFHNGSWFLATTKGFLLRSSGLSERGTPVLGGDNTAFWGARSRERMGHLRNLYRGLSSGDQSASLAYGGSQLEVVQSGWSWFHWSSSPFVTPLVVQGARVLGMTANQYVYSVELESGKIAWAQRVGSTEDLQLESRALAVTSGFVVAGNAEGSVSFLNAGTGQLEFQIELPRKPGERFAGIVAQPLVAGQRILASNGSSTTVMINERNRKMEWQIQHGSVASPRRWGETAFLGTVDGRLLKLDIANGTILGQQVVRQGEPIASLSLVLGGQYLLVAMTSGDVFVVRAADLSIEQSFASQGSILGEWIGIEDQMGSCISTRAGSIRCFGSMTSG